MNWTKWIIDGMRDLWEFWITSSFHKNWLRLLWMHKFIRKNAGIKQSKIEWKWEHHQQPNYYCPILVESFIFILIFKLSKDSSQKCFCFLTKTFLLFSINFIQHRFHFELLIIFCHWSLIYVYKYSCVFLFHRSQYDDEKK